MEQTDRSYPELAVMANTSHTLLVLSFLSHASTRKRFRSSSVRERRQLTNNSLQMPLEPYCKTGILSSVDLILSTSMKKSVVSLERHWSLECLNVQLSSLSSIC